MDKLHIANTFFEWELETAPKMSLSEAFLQHPIFRQLQFLSILYADKNDFVLLSDLPDASYWEDLSAKGIAIPPYFTLDEKKFSKDFTLESWGPSQLVAEWAARRSLRYEIPDWQIVKRVNSKQFSFEKSPRLPQATLLSDEIQTRHWLQSAKGKKVLKTCFGVSGKGHLLIDERTSWEKIHSFAVKEWNKQLPVIAEPWVKRVLDFSTQWHIDQTGNLSYIGPTICKNDDRGRYQFNLVGDEKSLFPTHLPFLLEHKKAVEDILRSIAKMGFFGNIGIDAMLYTLDENPDRILLHPVVEINARKTMGWAALQFQKRYFPNETVRFSFSSSQKGFLPEFVESKQGKKVGFSRNIICANLSQ